MAIKRKKRPSHKASDWKLYSSTNSKLRANELVKDIKRGHRYRFVKIKQSVGLYKIYVKV